MGKPWRELVCVTAYYYKAGEHPWPDFQDAEQMITEHEASDPDDWWAQGDLWWFPGAGEYRKDGEAYACQRETPDLDAAHRLITDAVQFTRVTASGPNGTHEFYGPAGLLNHEFDGNGIRDTLIAHVDDIKALCDLVRGDKADRWVDALIVFECDAGKDPDTWAGPGDYWSDWQPIGLLDLKLAALAALDEQEPPR